MSSNDIPVYKYIQLSGNLYVPSVFFVGGIFCSSSTAGTVKIWDNSAASGAVIIDTVALTAGQYYQIPAATLSKNIFITVGGTLSATLFYN